MNKSVVGRKIDINAIKRNYTGLLGDSRVILKFKASSEIGLGHLSRMMTLASFLKEAHIDVICAINNDRYAAERLKEEGLKFIVNKLKTDEEFLDFLMKKFSPNIILIDEKYEYKKEDIKRWKEKCKLVVLDFIGKDYELCNKIIMPNAHFEPEKYKNFNNIVWGWDWVLINKEVIKLKPREKLPKNIENIVVTTGGSDPEGVLFHIIDWLEGCKQNVFLLVGEAFRYKEKIENIILPNNFKILPYNPSYLLKGDIAITTFGVTVYELIYLNIPTICIAHTRENAAGSKILQDKFDAIRNIGYFKDIKA